MAKIRISFVIGCCLISMAVHGGPPTPIGSGSTIVAGAITVGPSGKISGTFSRVKGGDDAGDTGGACLTYQYAKSPTICKNNGECNVTITTKSGTTLPQGHGYCDVDHSIFATSPAGTCWYKPLPNDISCMKSPTLPLIENVEYQTPLVDTKAAKPGASWRVVTCQNLAPLGCSNETDTTKKVIRFGKIWHHP
jgi:hypothetical protein